MSGSKRRRRPRPVPPSTRTPDTAVEENEKREPQRAGPFGSALFGGGESALPPIGRSLGRGLLVVATQPALAVAACVFALATWLVLVGIGFEGVPSRLVDVLAIAPIGTFFDFGNGGSLYGLGPGLFVFMGVSIVIRALVVALLTGAILDAIEDGKVSSDAIHRGIRAIPTALVVQFASFSLLIAGNLILPLLGPGIGFLGFVSVLVAGLFFLGFAPAAAVREGRPVMDTIRRSARAAMLPRGRHLLLCSLYFFIALPVVVGFAPGGGEVTANPTLVAWVFILLVNIVHVVFMAAFAYRWVLAESEVPEEPVRRRTPARAPSRGARRR